MVFAPDTEMSIAAAVEMVNTARRRDGHDAMATVDDVAEFYTRWGYTARHDGDDAELAAVRDARDQIAALWDVDRDTAAGVLNEMLARGGAVPYLDPARRPGLAPARHRAGRPAGDRAARRDGDGHVRRGAQRRVRPAPAVRGRRLRRGPRRPVPEPLAPVLRRQRLREPRARRRLPGPSGRWADRPARRRRLVTSIDFLPLRDVDLRPGAFLTAQDRVRETLLGLSADRLLAPFRREAGLPPRAEPYGGWESTGLDGHTAGHVLSALATLAESTGDAQVRARAEQLVAGLRACQVAGGTGYVGGIPDGASLWDELRRGDIREATLPPQRPLGPALQPAQDVRRRRRRVARTGRRCSGRARRPRPVVGRDVR